MIKGAIKHHSQGLDHEKRRKIVKILMVAVIVIFALSIVVRPGILGYTTYQKVQESNHTLETYAQNIDELEAEIFASQEILAAVKELNVEILNRFEEGSGKETELQGKVALLETKLALTSENYQQQIDSLKANIEDKEDEIQELEQQLDSIENTHTTTIVEIEKECEDNIGTWEEDYDALALNTANSVCCKAKFDNPYINYYKIENNKIVCSEFGELGISCSF